MTALVVTFLFPTLPPVGLSELEAGLRADCTTEDTPCAPEIHLTAHETPLGGEAFCGTIPRNAPPGKRAALLGIVSRHEAHMVLTIALPDGQDVTRQHGLRLALRASQALSRRYPPLALLWGPTRRLMQTAELDAIMPGDEPLWLFVSIREEVLGPRRVPSLALEGARTWIGHELHARPGTLPRDTVRHAALAFLTAARQSPELVQVRSFHHGGRIYRLAHSTSPERIDLIPVADAPLAMRSLPHLGLHLAKTA